MKIICICNKKVVSERPPQHLISLLQSRSCYTYTNPSTGQLKKFTMQCLWVEMSMENRKVHFREVFPLWEKTVPISAMFLVPIRAFCLPGRKDVQTVIVFEASIDAISNASIYKDAGLDYKSCDRIALGGTEKTIGLITYLQNHPQITRVAMRWMRIQLVGLLTKKSVRYCRANHMKSVAYGRASARTGMITWCGGVR